MFSFASADGFPVHAVEIRARDPLGAFYFSAGIHGDEAASTEALLHWCARRAAVLSRFDVLAFPCLNPWGLQQNSRFDASGRDLNRAYRNDGVPMVAAQKKLVGDRFFDAAVMLHEDFDAHGVYIYEIPGARPFWGEELAEAAARHVRPEPRSTVEGRRCRGGVIRSRVTADTLPDHPEAFFLRFGHTRRSLTLETPSEFSITARVGAHVAMLDRLLKLVAG